MGPSKSKLTRYLFIHAQVSNNARPNIIIILMAVCIFSVITQVMSVCFNDTTNHVLSGGLDNDIKARHDA